MSEQKKYSTDNPFRPELWHSVEGFEDLTDITYHRLNGEGHKNGIVRIAFDRPEVRNAFRPHTVDELYRALDHARRTPDVGTILLTGNGPSEKYGGWAFCSGGDQRIRGRSGYRYATEHAHDDATADESTVDTAREKVEAAACISSRSSALSAPCPRWLSPWSMVGRPAAATRCTWSAI